MIKVLEKTYLNKIKLKKKLIRYVCTKYLTKQRTQSNLSDNLSVSVMSFFRPLTAPPWRDPLPFPSQLFAAPSACCTASLLYLPFCNPGIASHFFPTWSLLVSWMSWFSYCFTTAFVWNTLSRGFLGKWYIEPSFLSSIMSENSIIANSVSTYSLVDSFKYFFL